MPKRLTVSEALEAGLTIIYGPLGMASLAPDPGAPCQSCGHPRIDHSLSRSDDFACRRAGCDCHWDPFLADG